MEHETFSEELYYGIRGVNQTAGGVIAIAFIPLSLILLLPIRSIDFYYSEFQAAHGLIFPRQIQNLRSGESK